MPGMSVLVEGNQGSFRQILADKVLTFGADLGFFSYFLPEDAKPIPFIVNWDAESRKYLLRALLPDPPAQGAAAGDRAHQFAETYRQRAVLKDVRKHVRSHLTISGYRMQCLLRYRDGPRGSPSATSLHRPRLSPLLEDCALPKNGSGRRYGALDTTAMATATG
jgi:hypothetical protein